MAYQPVTNFKLMRGTLLFLFLLFLAFNCPAQQLKYKAFTVNNGLPSNHVYRCVEDDKGFLWVATDAGVARFDGRHFQVFTTQQGLPDNEVLSVVKENDGTIWVNCFKQSPSYFDEEKNRFINAAEDSELAKVQVGTALMYLYCLKEGGVLFSNENGTFVFRNRKLVTYPWWERTNFIIKELPDGSVIRWGNFLMTPPQKINTAKLIITKDDVAVDSVTLNGPLVNGNAMLALNNGAVYNFYIAHDTCFVYRDINASPLRYKKDSIILPEHCFFFNTTNKWIVFYANSGVMYVYDENTLQLVTKLEGDYFANALYHDKRGNIWICSIDKGLLLYETNKFKYVPMPYGFTHTNFLSIARKPDGALLAGNFYGEVLEAKGTQVKINYTAYRTKGVARVRKIVVSQGKVFTFSEMGIFRDYAIPLSSTGAFFLYAKTALALNDSIVIIGNVGKPQKLNTITDSVVTLNQPSLRLTGIANEKNNSVIYLGSTNGLFKFNYPGGTIVQLPGNDPLLTERITGLTISSDGLLWVATASKGVLVVKNEKVIANITEKTGLINEAARGITAAGPGQVWLGTSAGISVINYTYNGGKLNYTTRNITVNDGLTNNVINEMLYDNDTVYATTADGISIIPARFTLPKFDIPVHLVRVSINQHDTVIATRYKLAYKQHNIQIQLAGVELSGHFKNLQYTLDGNKNWITLPENILTLQLNSGNHVVEVRAVDVNGNVSDKVLSVVFDIETPFWKNPWFWIVVGVVLQALALVIINRWLKQKREERLAREIASVQTAALEQQAFTSLMNPHFLFNALNSIQHYINVQDRKNANRYLSDFASLIRKNFEAAQMSFLPLEQEMENIKIYLRLEQMRFNDRFTYEININSYLDVEQWMIPTMMLQPFLENALLHGIMPSAIKGRVVVDFTEQGNNLLITITDNGIGIANSMALKESGAHKSLGMELIQKRIAALSRFGVQPISIHISPLTTDENNPGNRITLLIAAGLYEAWQLAQQ